MNLKKVQINNEWKEIAADAGDEVTFDQVIIASGVQKSRYHVYRITYKNALGPGGALIGDVLNEGGRVKVLDETTTFTVSDGTQT